MVKIRRKLAEAGLSGMRMGKMGEVDDSVNTHLYERVKCVGQMMPCFDPVRSKYKIDFLAMFRMGGCNLVPQGHKPSSEKLSCMRSKIRLR